MRGVPKSAMEARNTKTAAAEISGAMDLKVMSRKMASSGVPKFLAASSMLVSILTTELEMMR